MARGVRTRLAFAGAERCGGAALRVFAWVLDRAYVVALDGGGGGGGRGRM